MDALFVKQLTTLDFSYLCPKRGLIGETWIVDVTLSGRLNSEGMVFDFAHVKKLLKQEADRFADHKLLVPTQSEFISHSSENEQTKVVMNSTKIGKIICQAPADAINLLPVAHISTDSLLPWLIKHLKQFIPDNVCKIELALYPEAISGAYYHYSHGLKKHSGDCQRIAHGHRSQLEVYINNKRSAEAEKRWAERWKDIYLATSDDKKETFTCNQNEYLTFAYEANQGQFSLTLPANHCYVIDTDTTVELLTRHAVQTMKDWYPESTIKVMLYEGVDKGAVSSS